MQPREARRSTAQVEEKTEVVLEASAWEIATEGMGWMSRWGGNRLKDGLGGGMECWSWGGGRGVVN